MDHKRGPDEGRWDWRSRRTDFILSTWEEINGWTLDAQRSGEFSRSSAIDYLAHFDDETLVEAAQVARRQHPEGHLLLHWWLNAARRVLHPPQEPSRRRVGRSEDVISSEERTQAREEFLRDREQWRAESIPPPPRCSSCEQLIRDNGGCGCS